MTLSPLALTVIGLLLAAWTMAAAWAVLSARQRERRAEASQRHAKRLARMVDESPALPLLVRVDGKIEAPQRLANWLGLDAVPRFLTELDGGRIDGGGGGLTGEQLAQLTEAVRRTQKTAAPFRMVVTPRGSKRSLALRGHLADMGAEVLKIEDPGPGDYARTMGAVKNQVSQFFVAVNRGKQFMRLDLKQADDRERFLALAATADVVVESFRPGVMDKLGLGWSVLKERNPRLVMCAISGYGADGPFAHLAGHGI